MEKSTARKFSIENYIEVEEEGPILFVRFNRHQVLDGQKFVKTTASVASQKAGRSERDG